MEQTSARRLDFCTACISNFPIKVQEAVGSENCSTVSCRVVLYRVLWCGLQLIVVSSGVWGGIVPLNASFAILVLIFGELVSSFFLFVLGREHLVRGVSFLEAGSDATSANLSSSLVLKCSFQAIWGRGFLKLERTLPLQGGLASQHLLSSQDFPAGLWPPPPSPGCSPEI